MPRARAAAGLAIVVVLAAASGCDDRETASDTAPELAPLAIADQEDPVCGMLVRNQSAPRGQVQHRDGSRFAVCSLGDLLVHLSAPSRHGAVTRVWVEVLAPDEDPGATHLEPHPWVDAGDATFVVGVPRRGIMGTPILSYRSPEDADAVVQAHPGARSFDFEQLQRWWRERN